jgi:hypothetical protein
MRLGASYLWGVANFAVGVALGGAWVAAILVRVLL